MAVQKLTSLGEMIKEDIVNKGLNQSLIAKRMGYERQIINQIANRKTFDLEFLQKLKDASGLDYTNYVFNPKRKEYVILEDKTMVEEPRGNYGQTTVEMLLSVIIRGEHDQLAKMSDLLMAFKTDASRLGFSFK